MRIGIDARSLYYSAGGIGRTTRLLIEALWRANDAHEEMVLFHSRKHRPWQGSDFSLRGGVRPVPLWTPSHHRWEQWTLPIELALHRLDVLHSPDFIPPFHRLCPAVITVHDLAFLRSPDLLTEESRRYYGQVRRAVRSAQGVAAVSEATKRDMVELLGVAAERVSVIHWGMEPHFQTLPEEEVRAYIAQRGLPERFILWLGVIEPRKNLAALLRALADLKQRGCVPLPLVVAGATGWLAEETLDLISTLHLEELVHRLGSFEPAEQPLLYNAAQAFLFPSLYEGFGLPPLEAMACGTPVAAANTPALCEVLGSAALFVDPEDVQGWADAIQRLVEDEPLHGRLRVDGLARAARFRWEDTARAYLQLYRQAAA